MLVRNEHSYYIINCDNLGTVVSKFMTVFFKKLLLGSSPSMKPVSAIGSRIKNIKAIWNNAHDNDLGIEKLFRLFLAASPFFFLGLYIKQIAGKRGHAYQDLAVDFFILLKVFFPFALIYWELGHSKILFAILIWFMAETILYVPTLVFASDSLARPRSYRRSMLMLFFNYIEIILDFSVIYSLNNFLNQPFKAWYDPIYFSFTTSASIGFGDFFPVTGMGKFIVSCQSIIFLMFVVVFLNFFSAKVVTRGYFDDSKES